jgi:hypothetical protein
VSAALEGLIPELQEYARALDQEVHAAGLRGSFTSTRRSHAEQKRLFDRYMRGEAQYPALPPGQSAHEYGYAFDYLVSPYEYQADVGALWQSWGGIWGGRKDEVHFEYPGFSPPPIEETPWYADVLSWFYPRQALDIMQGPMTPVLRSDFHAIWEKWFGK